MHGAPEVTLDTLADHPIWVAWRADPDKKTGKLTKRPYNPHTGEWASCSNAATWGTRAEAEVRVKELTKSNGWTPAQAGGIGLMFRELGDGTAIGGLDLDSCRDEATEKLAAWASKVVALLKPHYTEVSPSGTGLKAFFLYRKDSLPALQKALRAQSLGAVWKDRSSGADHAPGIEIYLGERYFAVTGQRFSASDKLTTITAKTLAAIRLIGLKLDRKAPAKGTAADGDCSRDESNSGAAYRFVLGLRRNNPELTVEEAQEAVEASEDAQIADWAADHQKDLARQVERIWGKVEKRAAELRDHDDMKEKAKTEVEAAVERLNQDHFMVNENGKALIFTPMEDDILHRRYYERKKERDFRILHQNEPVHVGTRKNGTQIIETAAEVWLKSPQRRQFLKGVVFDPRGTKKEGVLNLWQGFAVEPAPGDWGLLKDHIFTILCRKDRVVYAYAMGWMAALIQRPWEQGHIAIVMKGGEGVGKSTLARALMRLLGQHGLAISQTKHLVGDFNAHLRDCIFLFADEAFYAGDKQHIGVLKTIITEPTLAIEGKGVDVFQAPNLIHLMMASNNEWVIPASLDARRFLMLDVSDERVGDKPYFRAIWNQLENEGGFAAMLHELQNYDLSDFEIRDVPKTDALNEQKLLSLSTFNAWWLEVLETGYLWGQTKLGEFHTTGDLYDASYRAFAEKRRDNYPMQKHTWGRPMAKVGLKAQRSGSHGYQFRDLTTLRAQFLELTGLVVEWDGDAPETAMETKNAPSQKVVPLRRRGKY